jgi:hypothetical protein
MEVNGQLHTPAALNHGKEPQNTNRIGGRVGSKGRLTVVEDRKTLLLPGIKSRQCSPYLVAALSELYRLSNILRNNNYIGAIGFDI